VREKVEKSEFLEKIEEELKEIDMLNPVTIDFYRVLGRRERVLIHAIEPHQYFKDIDQFDSFIRLRRDHLTKLGVSTSIEVSEPDYLAWAKTPKS